MPSALANEGCKLCIKLPPNKKAGSANGRNRQGSGVRFCTLHRWKKRTFRDAHTDSCDCPFSSPVRLLKRNQNPQHFQTNNERLAAAPCRARARGCCCYNYPACMTWLSLRKITDLCFILALVTGSSFVHFMVHDRVWGSRCLGRVWGLMTPSARSKREAQGNLKAPKKPRLSPAGKGAIDFPRVVSAA